MGYYEQEVELAKRQKVERIGGAIVRKWKNINFRQNTRGARSAFLIDTEVGHRTGGMTAAVNKIAPGSHLASHRHGGEAIIFIAEGRGYSLLDGEKLPWEKGDMFLVGKWLWHQHFNDDPNKTAIYVRVHAGDSIGNTMRIVLDPLELTEHKGEPGHYEDAPDMSALDWADDDEHHI